jgi:hypothetical protein
VFETCVSETVAVCLVRRFPLTLPPVGHAWQARPVVDDSKATPVPRSTGATQVVFQEQVARCEKIDIARILRNRQSTACQFGSFWMKGGGDAHRFGRYGSHARRG